MVGGDDTCEARPRILVWPTCGPSVAGGEIGPKVFEDQVFEDQVFEDQIFEDQIFEDQIFENQVFPDLTAATS